MQAQLDRTSPPAPGPAPVVHLGEHSTFTLDNGLKVIVVENHKLPIVSVQIRFDIPPFTQGPKAGMTDLVSELLTSGTKNHTKSELDEAVDRIGASLNSSSDGLYATSLKKNIGPIMELIREVIQEPTFPEAEFAKAQTRYRSAIQQRKDDPDAISDVVGKAAIFGTDHPYGEITTLETLNKVDAATLRAYHQHYFRPESGYLVFVGDLDRSEAEELAKTYFGNWNPEGKGRVPGVLGELIQDVGTVRYLTEAKMPPTYRQVVLVDRPDAPQSLIRISYPFNLRPQDIRALDAQVLNTILGGGVFNARLMQNLREDKGYTYGVYSSMESDRYNGNFTASTSVRTEVTEQAVSEILKEMERLRNEPVPRSDLDLAKRYMAGSFARSLEDPRTVARFALNTMLNGLPDDHYATYLKRLEKITVEDIQRAASAFLRPENAIVFVVGDKEKIRRSLIPISMEPFIPVIELDVEGQVLEPELEMVEGVTADQVIANYITALGGEKAVAKIKTMDRIWSGSMTNAVLEIHEKFGPGAKYKLEYIADGQALRTAVCDGDRVVDVIGNSPEELTDDRLREFKLWAEPVPEIEPVMEPIARFFDGKTSIGGKPVYKITTNVGEIDVTTDYFDVTSGLKVRRVMMQRNFGQFYVVTTDYLDYRPENGVMLPHTIIQDGGSTGVFTVTQKSINFDPAFGSGTFDVEPLLGH